MKTLLIAIASLILTTSISVGADEYVTLTATDGRKVEVEIIGVSSDGNEVTVRRKEGGGNIVVPISSFNDESQTCIKKWVDKPKEVPAPSVNLKLLISNGDFEKGSTSWDGDKNVVYETEQKTNQVCRIQVGKNEVKFFQKINGRQDKKFIIKLKIKKSSDYVGEGIVIEFTDNVGNGFGRNVQIGNNNDWKQVEVTVKTQREKDVDIRKVNFIVGVGTSGFIDFDDIEVYRIE